MNTESGSGESLDELRQRLNNMKKLMNDRQTTAIEKESRRSQPIGVIDGGFLSFVFTAALVLILTVSVYAFYNLYYAILKKFPTYREEL